MRFWLASAEGGSFTASKLIVIAPAAWLVQDPTRFTLHWPLAGAVLGGVALARWLEGRDAAAYSAATCLFAVVATLPGLGGEALWYLARYPRMIDWAEMRAGATNYLTKPVNGEQLLASVAEAIEADRALRRDNADLIAGRQRLATLTARERQVLDRVVAGRLNKQTADELGTALKTIKVHRARMMSKMNVKSLAQLARLVERMGIVPGR